MNNFCDKWDEDKENFKEHVINCPECWPRWKEGVRYIIRMIKEELEDEQLDKLVLECVKELYSREKKTEMEYVIKEYGSED